MTRTSDSRGRHRALVAGFVMLATGAAAGPAYAHFLGNDSVDGREIRYEDYSRWDDAHNVGMAGWENLAGGVNIAPDSWSTVTDLEYRDYSSSSDGYCGYWTGRTGADLIALNNHYYNGATTTNRRACAIHEWGHAHGLAHSYSDQVMHSCPVSSCGSTYTVPQSHDRSDYNYLWN